MRGALFFRTPSKEVYYLKRSTIKGNTVSVLSLKMVFKAEVMNIKMPVHQNDIRRPLNIMEGAVNIFLKRFKFLDFDETIKKRYFITASYNYDYFVQD